MKKRAIQSHLSMRKLVLGSSVGSVGVEGKEFTDCYRGAGLNCTADCSGPLCGREPGVSGAVLADAQQRVKFVISI